MAQLDPEGIMGIKFHIIESDPGILPANTLILIENLKIMSYPKEKLEQKYFMAGRSFLFCFIISIIAACFHLCITLALVACM